jgi:hypothetical protein
MFMVTGSIDIIFNRLINGTYQLTCFALLVLLVTAAKIHFEELALVAGTDKAFRLARQPGSQVKQANKVIGGACFVMGPLAWFCAHH